MQGVTLSIINFETWSGKPEPGISLDGLQEEYRSKLGSHNGNFNLLIIYVNFLTLERPQKNYI
jgi:hypothetical protein